MHVLVNVAASADGKLSNRRREQLAISGSEDFARVHRLRAERDAILVGVGTVLADDPNLTVDPDRLIGRLDSEDRLDGQPTDAAHSNPIRVVVDSRARTPTDAGVLDAAAETWILVSEAAPDERRRALEDVGATVVIVGEGRVDLADGLVALEEAGVQTVLVEGGGEVIASMFESGLVDELTQYVGPTIVGGRDAPTVADGVGFVDSYPSLRLVNVERLDDGVVLHWSVE